jgi:hypothetical protein
VDVLIGKPDSQQGDNKIETLLEQLRQRQLSVEQLETYEKQKTTAEKLRELNEATAQANMQTQLTNQRVQVRIAESQGEADLVRARKQAEQAVVVADAELACARRQAEQTVVQAEANSQERILAGRGEAQRTMQVGLAESAVLLRKINSFGDPRLYALSMTADRLSHSAQPLVPERVFVSGANGESGQFTGGMLGTLINLLVAEKSGFSLGDTAEQARLKELADKLTEQALSAMQPEESAMPGAQNGRSLGGSAALE